MKSNQPYNGSEIAIIGLSGRFPGANTLDEYWKNLLNGVDSIERFSQEELIEVGIDSSLVNNPNYVKAKGILSGSNEFDAAFFGYSDREATIMDPQLRLYYECAWHALENAGYAGLTTDDQLVGVFGGASANALWTAQYAGIAQQGGAAAYEIINLIGKDFFNTRLAYTLNLKGPAVTVQTACSTALVAIHLAVQSLLSGDTDVALAGAVSLSTNPALSEPQKQGYLYQEGMILAPDGECRPFDASAQGTVVSDGVGFVVLKRLQDAQEAGDNIYCILKGSAINNDGKDKAGYTAPSVQGQQTVIEAALEVAEVDADQISYIETHGTGTSLGDPIEMQALAHVYSDDHIKYLGAVKSNIGHLDTAAGMAGLIKAILAIKHQVLPPNAHFNALNPKCEANSSGFTVLHEKTDWKRGESLLCGVSSFGIGGTNAHVILEEYISQDEHQRSETDDVYLLPVSGKSESAAQENYSQIQAQLPKLAVADVAYTLQQKRAHFEHRQGLVVDTSGRVLHSLNAAKAKPNPHVYFMFSGQGTQYLAMGRELYHQYSVYKAELDQCLTLVRLHSDLDIRALLLDAEHDAFNETRLQSTDNAQIALFIVEYSLAKLLMSWGIEPKGFIGHSLGEYVAACLANVFSLSDAIKLIAARGQLMAKTKDGGMLAVHLSADLLAEKLPAGIAIAAINAASSTVVSGESAEINLFAEQLTEQDIAYQRLRTSGAFHSAVMDPILDDFQRVLDDVQFSEPTCPIISNVTGNWVTAGQMTSTGYWLQHLRGTVQFHQGLSVLFDDPSACLVEVGPGHTLQSFARNNSKYDGQQLLTTTLRSHNEQGSDPSRLMRAMGELYAHGVHIHWPALTPSTAKFISLPGYAFDRKTYLPQFSGFEHNTDAEPLSLEYYRECWQQHDVDAWYEPQQDGSDQHVLVFLPDASVLQTEILLSLLQQHGSHIITVEQGQRFERVASGHYRLSPQEPADYHNLFSELIRINAMPNKVLNFWHTKQTANEQHDASFLFLLQLTQALNQVGHTEPLAIYHVAEGAYQVCGDEWIQPEARLAYGPLRVIGQEHKHLSCHLFDIPSGGLNRHIDAIVMALFSTELPLLCAFRGRNIWTQDFQSEGGEWQAKVVSDGFRDQGVYLITGGFGGLGQELALYLAKHYQAKLVLCSRRDNSHHGLLAQIQASGGQAVAVQADMQDPHALNVALDCAITSFGRLNGIIHTAGVPGETMIQRHDLNQAQAVIDTKIACANLMVEQVKALDLDMLVFYSSVTSILGGMGQADYTAANAYLDAVALNARNNGLKQVYSINWDAWGDVGMAVNALNGPRNIIKNTSHALLGDMIVNDDSHCIFKQTFTPERQWVLDEHWVMGTPTVPGTTYIEMARAAFAEATGRNEGCLREVYFLTPLSIQHGEVADVYCILRKSADSASAERHAYEFEIGSYHHSERHWQCHAKGQIADATASGSSYEIAGLQQQYQEKHLRHIHGAADLGMQAMGVTLTRQEQDALMKYGQRWDVVKEVWSHNQGGLARLELDEAFLSDLKTMRLHPALLDCAVSFLRAFIEQGVYIPISYLDLTQHQPLPATFYSHVRLHTEPNPQQGVMSFDIDLLAEDGSLLVAIKQMTMKRIDSDFTKAPQLGIPLPIPDYVHQQTKLAHGLATKQALQALEQIIGSSRPNTVVVASDFSARLANADQGDVDALQSALELPTTIRPRPELDVGYTPPKNDTQKTIAVIWQTFLGLDKVGIHDDFFALGGDSLLLMQIHEKVKASIQATLPIAELYNLPTISQLSAYLENQASDSPDTVLDNVDKRIEKKKQAAARRRKGRRGE